MRLEKFHKLKICKRYNPVVPGAAQFSGGMMVHDSR